MVNIMNNKGKHAEELVELVEHLYRDNIDKTTKNYKWRDKCGASRETDLFVLLKDGKKIAFEVRDRQRVQSIDWIDQVVGKYKDSEFDLIWICTHNKCTLSRDAVKKLNENKIGWRKITSSKMENEIKVAEFTYVELDWDNLETSLKEKFKDIVIVYQNTQTKEQFELKLTDIIKQQLMEVLEHEELGCSRLNFLEGTLEVDHNLFQNIDSDDNFIHYIIPIVYNTFFDYFNEKVEIKDIDENEFVLKSKLNTIFMKSDGTLCINLSINQIFEGLMLTNNFKIYKENIKKLVPIFNNTVRFIKTHEGTGIVPLKIWGYNK